MLLLAEQLPRRLERVEASAVLTFPTRRRRDEGNYRALLEKALGDALVEGRWLVDDTPERFTFGTVSFAEGQPRTAIELRCRVPAQRSDDATRAPPPGSARSQSRNPG